MIEEQLKQLAEEAIIETSEENDEEEVGWIVEQTKLDDDAKLVILKELATYSMSNEFKTLANEFKSKIPSIHKEIKEKLAKRKKTEVTKSVLDEYVAICEATQEIADKVGNQTLKDYLIKARIEAYESAIINKKGIVERAGMAVHFDMPIYTEIDILKEKASVYASVEQFLKFVISIYDFKGIMDRKKGEKEDNPHQPY